MCHDWPVKNAIVNLPISVKENSKRTSGNSLGPNLHFKDTSDEFVC